MQGDARTFWGRGTVRIRRWLEVRLWRGRRGRGWTCGGGSGRGGWCCRFGGVGVGLHLGARLFGGGIRFAASRRLGFAFRRNGGRRFGFGAGRQRIGEQDGKDEGRHPRRAGQGVHDGGGRNGRSIRSGSWRLTSPCAMRRIKRKRPLAKHLAFGLGGAPVCRSPKAGKWHPGNGTTGRLTRHSSRGARVSRDGSSRRRVPIARVADCRPGPTDGGVRDRFVSAS